MAQGSVIVPLQLERAQEEAALLDYAVRTARGAVYLHCTGPAATSPPTTTTLDYLTHCLEPSAHGKPRCDVFPLLPFLGWSPDRLASCLADAEEMVAAAEHAQECRQLLDQLNAGRQQAGLPSFTLTLTAGHAAVAAAAAGQQQQQHGDKEQEAKQQGQQQEHAGSSTGGGGGSGGGGGGPNGGAPCQLPPAGPCSRVLGGWQGPLQFSKVAVGGTFDRLHAGHRLLLASTALVATEYIFVGITADKLLAKKKNRELLESYDERQAAAVGYMQMINPRAKVVAGPLNDPNEPPVAATDPAFDAIVVSEETVPGADAINAVRQRLGFAPLAVVVIGLIYSRRQAAKLSSTDLRQAEAAGMGGGSGGGSGSPGRLAPPPA